MIVMSSSLIRSSGRCMRVGAPLRALRVTSWMLKKPSMKLTKSERRHELEVRKLPAARNCEPINSTMCGSANPTSCPTP